MLAGRGSVHLFSSFTSLVWPEFIATNLSVMSQGKLEGISSRVMCTIFLFDTDIDSVSKCSMISFISVPDLLFKVTGVFDFRFSN